jgi:hypothetical protein
VARRIRPGKLIAAGALSLLVCQVLLAVATTVLRGSDTGYYAVHTVLGVIGFSAAFVAVPVQTFLQSAPEEGTRGKTFAVNNFLNFTFIFLAGGYYFGTSAISLHPAIAASVSALLMCLYCVLNLRSVLSIQRPAKEH